MFIYCLLAANHISFKDGSQLLMLQCYSFTNKKETHAMFTITIYILCYWYKLRCYNKQSMVEI